MNWSEALISFVLFHLSFCSVTPFWYKYMRKKFSCYRRCHSWNNVMIYAKNDTLSLISLSLPSSPARTLTSSLLDPLSLSLPLPTSIYSLSDQTNSFYSDLISFVLLLLLLLTFCISFILFYFILYFILYSLPLLLLLSWTNQ